MSPRRVGVYLLVLLSIVVVLAAIRWWRQQASPERVVAITAVEVEFSPKQITVRPGAVTIRLTNRGNDQHNFVLAGPDGKDIDGVPSISAHLKPGQVAEKTFTLGAGTYAFYCNWSSHYQLGMTGVLTVK